MQKIDTQLAAFLAGLFIGLMVVRHVYKKVVQLETATERGRDSDGNQTSRPSPTNIMPLPQTG